MLTTEYNPEECASIPISEQLEIIRRVEGHTEISFLHDFCTIAIVDLVQRKAY